MEFTIIRNSETEAEAEGRFEGQSDSPVTSRGQRQAKTVAAGLDPDRIEVVYASPLKRALDTAKLVSQQLLADIRIAPELEDICYGEWEQQPHSTVESTALWDKRDKNPYTFTYPGEYDGTPGESYADLASRTTGFIDDLLDSEFDKIGIVTHLDVVRMLKKRFENRPPAEATAFSLSPTEIYRVEITDNRTETTVADLS